MELLKKETPVQVLSCKFYKNVLKELFSEHLWGTTSLIRKWTLIREWALTKTKVIDQINRPKLS